MKKVNLLLGSSFLTLFLACLYCGPKFFPSKTLAEKRFETDLFSIISFSKKIIYVDSKQEDSQALILRIHRAHPSSFSLQQFCLIFQREIGFLGVYGPYQMDQKCKGNKASPYLISGVKGYLYPQISLFKSEQGEMLSLEGESLEHEVGSYKFMFPLLNKKEKNLRTMFSPSSLGGRYPGMSFVPPLIKGQKTFLGERKEKCDGPWYQAVEGKKICGPSRCGGKGELACNRGQLFPRYKGSNTCDGKKNGYCSEQRTPFCDRYSMLRCK